MVRISEESVNLARGQEIGLNVLRSRRMSGGEVVKGTGESAILEVMAWVRSDLEADHSLGSMARRAHMSRRSFTRHFRRVAGASPYAWLLGQRIARAQDLLDDPSLTIESIAERAGFDGSGMLRRHFQRRVGCSPSAYRAVRSRADGHR
jgi:transcriptional regulator GlxA family with amidase domain